MEYVCEVVAPYMAVRSQRVLAHARSKYNIQRPKLSVLLLSASVYIANFSHPNSTTNWDQIIQTHALWGSCHMLHSNYNNDIYVVLAESNGE